MPRVEVERTYFEMAAPAELVPVESPDPRARVEKMAPCPVSLYRFLYQEVGRAYHWVDRRGWSDGEVAAHLARPEVSVYLLSVGEEPAGFFELVGHGDGTVELAYLGLLPAFIGRGLGGYLLTVAVREAWSRPARRLWLHTCSLDHPAAIPNYLRRGFRPIREETYEVELPGGRPRDRERGETTPDLTGS
jgi:GNAT superfamily N-acetyltransferase